MYPVCLKDVLQLNTGDIACTVCTCLCREYLCRIVQHVKLYSWLAAWVVAAIFFKVMRQKTKSLSST